MANITHINTRHKSANFPASGLVTLQFPQLHELSQHAPPQSQSLSPPQSRVSLFGLGRHRSRLMVLLVA